MIRSLLLSLLVATLSFAVTIDASRSSASLIQALRHAQTEAANPLQKTWVVLVAASAGYENYRHQADVCHAYQLVRENGIPPEQIVLFMFDDIARNPQNKFPGQLFNKPGNNSVDVYPGCVANYTGSDVNADMFISVITGDETKAKNGSLKMSTMNDNVFINLVDHGSPNELYFGLGGTLPVTTLNSTVLNAALKSMSDKAMFKRLAFYLEACESGSMFDGLLPNNTSIYAVTASKVDESSWGTYCPPNDRVNGVALGSCLGDLWSVNWMQDSDLHRTAETLAQQFILVRDQTKVESTPQVYGDFDYASDVSIFAFQGQGNRFAKETQETAEEKLANQLVKETSVVNSRQIALNNAFYAYMRAPLMSAAQSEALAVLSAQVSMRVKATSIIEYLSAAMTQDLNIPVTAHDLFTIPMPSSAIIAEVSSCIKPLQEAFFSESCVGMNEYTLEYRRFFINSCDQLDLSASDVAFYVQQLTELCSKSSAPAFKPSIHS